ncbi:hypothetical protein BDR26DRAFT_92478 [Obelidium mucronatum]|nr:hypothetical protein BDR26DRAFT_92478 [Obelidium mucronatum]
MFALTVQYGPGYNYLIDRTNDSKGVRYLDAVCDGKYLPAFTNQTATRSDLLAALQNLTITFLQKVGFKGDSDPSIYYWNTGYIRDRSLSNNWYLWYWQACNEFGYNQVAQSVTASSNQLISNWSTYSQSISLSYAHWMCKTQGLSPTGVPNTEYTTKYYNNGTNITTPRILWVNGQLDPWHWLSNYKAAPDPTTQTSLLYLNATHCNDLWGRQASFSAYQNQFYDQLFSVYDSWMATDFNPTGPEEISAVSSSLDTTKIVLIAAGGSTLVIGLGIIAYMKVKKHAYLQVRSLISQGSTMKGDRSKVNSSSTTRREMSATPV